MLSGEDVESEYQMINEKRKGKDGDVDEIVFFCYLKSRIEAESRKTSAFEDNVDTVFKGRFEDEQNRDNRWQYEEQR